MSSARNFRRVWVFSILAAGACSYVTDNPKITPITAAERLELAHIRREVAAQDARDAEEIRRHEAERSMGRMAAILGGVLFIGAVTSLVSDDGDASASPSDGAPDPPAERLDAASPAPSTSAQTTRKTDDRPVNEDMVIRGFIKYPGGEPRQVAVTARGDMNTQTVRTDERGYFEVKTRSSVSCLTMLFIDGAKVWTGRACSGDPPLSIRPKP